MTEIISISRPRKNGMYTDTYTVCYSNGKTKTYKTYTIKGMMINKHFEFIMNADVESIISSKGNHCADRFTKKSA